MQKVPNFRSIQYGAIVSLDPVNNCSESTQPIPGSIARQKHWCFCGELLVGSL